MLEKISLNNKTEIGQWDDFVERHIDGTPYHHSQWLKTIHETYSFKPLLYVKRNNSGDIVCVFPHFFIKSYFSNFRLVSIPFSDYGGALFVNNSFESDDIEMVKNEHGKTVNYIEIRNYVQQECDFCCHNYYKRHLLNLQADLSEIKKRINKRTILYSIRKAKKAGVEVKEENSQFGIDEFYRLNLLTRKKHGVPSQPKKFFDNLYNNIIADGHGFILIGMFNSKPIAASLFLTIGDQIHYKYNASDPEYVKSKSPNHLITWAAIKKGVEESARFIDFGRTSPENKGLMRYKEMWGAKPVDLPYFYYPDVQGACSTEESDPVYRMATRIWRLLPDSAIKIIGPVIYKHMA